MSNKRDILFRGKRADNGKWVNGYVTRIKHVDGNGNIESYYFNALDELGWAAERVVSAETVGQFTGLTDKNGRKIFEGDIVKEKSNEYIGIVRFGEYSNSDCGDKYFGVYVEWISENAKLYKQNLWFWLNDIGIEVIGNIFDNPELMEEA